jgi:hypothetical protein
LTRPVRDEPLSDRVKATLNCVYAEAPPVSQAKKNPELVGYNADVSEQHIASIYNVELLGLPPAFTLVFSSAYPTMKMEATYSSETSADFKFTARRYMPGDSTLDGHGCENLKI